MPLKIIIKWNRKYYLVDEELRNKEESSKYGQFLYSNGINYTYVKSGILINDEDTYYMYASEHIVSVDGSELIKYKDTLKNMFLDKYFEQHKDKINDILEMIQITETILQIKEIIKGYTYTFIKEYLDKHRIDENDL